jgi:hypothetical protein
MRYDLKMKILYEVLVPTMFGYPNVKPISTKHHKSWDKEVIKITGGMTLMKPAQGRWVDKGFEYPERVIPVRIMVDEITKNYMGTETYGAGIVDKTQITKIVNLTLKHYRQKAVMYYVISREVNIAYAPTTEIG